MTLYTEYWQTCLGVVLLAIVLAFPGGLLGIGWARRASSEGRRG
jgi:ABC-type branched-subunit amino acid transport system permease subunit